MKNYLLYILSCLAFSFLLCLHVQAQITSNTPSPNSAVPPSPTAASLGKYGAMPVSTYTGIPNINVPVYTIQSGSLNLPLSLSYHASGIRVSEEASWVGLGWSLFSGGAVTRSIRGVDDFNELTGVGYPDYVIPLTINGNNQYVPSSTAPWTELNFLAAANAGFKDPEPDIFYYNFDGHSGKFTISQRSSIADPYQFNIESQEKIKIELYQEGADRYWIFTTIDGKQYLFKTPEKTKTYSYANPDGETSPDQMFSLIVPQKRTSTWYLDKITAPDGNTIDFEYTTPPFTGMVPCGSRSESRSHLIHREVHSDYGCDPESPISHVYYSSHNEVFEVYLKKIRFSNGQIVFETSVRNDIKPYSAASLPQKLDKIRIYKKNGESFEEIKSVDFNYGYFTNSDPYLNYNIGGYSYNYSKTYSSKRLKLLSVIEKNGTSEKPPTLFDYINTNYGYGDIPDKYAKAQDHWGYFNNKGNTLVQDQTMTTGFVSTLLPSYSDFSRNVFYSGADKTPDEVQMQLGTLNKITYPTGGSTEFRYGINEYGNFPVEYVKVPHQEAALAYGDGVDPNEEPIFQGMEELPPATVQIDLQEETTLDVRFNVSYSLLWDCVNNPWGGQGSVMIRSTGSTPSFHRLIVGTLQCHGSYDVFETIVMPAGTYELVATGTYQVITQARVSWNKLTVNPLLSKKGAGLRIESTIDYDGVNHNNDIITTYNYTENVNGVDRSSGVLMSPLLYEYYYTMTRSMSCDDNTGVFFSSTYLNRTSESVIPLGSSAQGKTIGYGSVTVLHGVNGVNGKTVYTYKNEPERRPNQFIPNLPCTPNPSNGLLTSQIDYKYNPNISTGDPFQKVKKITREYENEIDSRKVTRGFKCHGCELLQEQRIGFALIPHVLFYDNLSEWWHLSSETITLYSDNDESKFLTSTTEYLYENPAHLQLTKTINTGSNGKVTTTVLKYPLDYNNITASDEISAGITDLKNNHILNPVIEKAVYHSDLNGSNTRLANAVFTAYDGKNPIKVFETEINTPITNFMPATVQGGAVVKDSRFIPQIIYDRYGNQGNIMQWHKSGDFNQSFLWDVTNIYPTAAAKNAGVDDIAYTSFELNESHNFWQYYSTAYNTGGVTGKQSLSLTGVTISKPGLSPSKKYIVSYWTTSSNSYSIAGTQGSAIKGDFKNGWTFFTHVVTGQNEITVSGNGLIDELKLYPEGAQMTTYTYDPLIGITSQCDAGNHVIYYEYDALGRLLRIRDQDNNILKKYDYKYQEQQ